MGAARHVPSPKAVEARGIREDARLSEHGVGHEIAHVVRGRASPDGPPSGGKESCRTRLIEGVASHTSPTTRSCRARSGRETMLKHIASCRHETACSRWISRPERGEEHTAAGAFVPGCSKMGERPCGVCAPGRAGRRSRRSRSGDGRSRRSFSRVAADAGDDRGRRVHMRAPSSSRTSVWQRRWSHVVDAMNRPGRCTRRTPVRTRDGSVRQGYGPDPHDWPALFDSARIRDAVRKRTTDVRADR